MVVGEIQKRLLEFLGVRVLFFWWNENISSFLFPLTVHGKSFFLFCAFIFGIWWRWCNIVVRPCPLTQTLPPITTNKCLWNLDKSLSTVSFLFFFQNYWLRHVLRSQLYPLGILGKQHRPSFNWPEKKLKYLV